MKTDNDTKELKVKTKSNIQYSGNVKIDFIKDNKVLKSIRQHNEGTEHLFNFLLNCLAGNYNKYDRPLYVVPFYLEDDSDPESTKKLSSDVSMPILGSPVVDAETSTIQYKILFLYNTLATKKINGFAMYSTANKPENIEAGNPLSDIANYSMIVNLEKTVNLTSDINILITWQLNVSNVIEQTE